MYTFQIYDDLILEIEILKEQIRSAEAERDQWWIDGKLFDTVSLDNAAGRVDRLNEKIKEMHEHLEFKIARVERLKEQLKQYQGLEYKIYYMRFVECKTLKEIAESLDYSYDYIREISSKMKAKEPTINPQTYCI